MKEYIEREALLETINEPWERIYEKCAYKPVYDLYRMVFERIKNAPAADVEPVRHGKWMPIITPFTTNRRVSRWRCSECREVVYNKQGNYCPKCGVKMVKWVEVINND